MKFEVNGKNEEWRWMFKKWSWDTFIRFVESMISCFFRFNGLGWKVPACSLWFGLLNTTMYHKIMMITSANGYFTSWVGYFTHDLFMSSSSSSSSCSTCDLDSAHRVRQKCSQKGTAWSVLADSVVVDCSTLQEHTAHNNTPVELCMCWLVWSSNAAQLVAQGCMMRKFVVIK